MRTFVSGKLHGIRVTDASVRYEGSVGIDAALMGFVGIAPFEQVHVVNLANGNRWITYALPIEARPLGRPQFTLNGGGAFLGEIGDECVVMTYRTGKFQPAQVLFLDVDNGITGQRTYRLARP